MTVPSVLDFPLADHGDVLVDREDSCSVVDRLAEPIRRGDTVLLTFANVRVALLPFVDSLLERLHVLVAEHDQSMLLVSDLDPVTRATVNHVLRARRMVLAELTPTGIRLMGDDGDLRTLMQVASNLDTEFSVQDLLERVPRGPGRVEAAVTRLVDAGALGGRGDRRLRRFPAPDGLRALTE